MDTLHIKGSASLIQRLARLMISIPNHMIFTNALSSKGASNSPLLPPTQKAVKFLNNPSKNLQEISINHSLKTMTST